VGKKNGVVPTLSAPMETQHVITMNDMGMAVVIAGLTSLLMNDGDAMPEDQRALVERMLEQFREGMKSGKEDRKPDILMPPGYERLQ
jgi:hypothetical protein